MYVYQQSKNYKENIKARKYKKKFSEEYKDFKSKIHYT